MEVLNSAVQQYAWGKKGSESMVAKLKGLGDSDYTVKKEETYAEMWMGTHPSGPSRVVRNGVAGPLLKEVLDRNPDMLGAIQNKGDLPFLFKVISINKALSIQAHPDKRLAERLHKERPAVYKDDNHKPEMAVTLTDFEGLCGFRRFHEILWNLHAYPELRGMVSLTALRAMCSAGNDLQLQRIALKKMFGAFVKCPPNVVKTQVAALVERLSQPHPPATEVTMRLQLALEEKRMTEIFGRDFRGGAKAAAALSSRLQREDVDVRRVMLRLSTEYPGDLGILMPLMLNLLQLSAGQAFFMTVDEPHAYLRGDILEVMACSNNVVRAALTPKFRDTNLLVEMLTYNMGAPAVLQAEFVDSKRVRYTPPITDFELEDLKVPVKESYHLKAMPVPGVLVCLCGCEGGRVVEEDTGKQIKAGEGGVFFLPANVGIVIKAGPSEPLHMAIAHTNLHWGPLAAAATGRAPTF
ncbi:unnamed protein product [Choristocarpus tenellus]